MNPPSIPPAPTPNSVISTPHLNSVISTEAKRSGETPASPPQTLRYPDASASGLISPKKKEGLQPRGLPLSPRASVFATRALALALAALTLAASAQTTAQTPAPPAAEAPAPPPGTVLFERHAITQPPEQDQPVVVQPPASDTLSGTALSDAERDAPTLTAWDLDARITPDTSALEVHARITLRNDSSAPLARIALQLSSALTWQSAALLQPGVPRTALPLVQHHLDTDADHTGSVSELILALPTPLPPGESLTLDTLYGGTVPPSAERLQRLGASPAQALDADWDAISPDPDAATPVALRGFGNVLWYPIASRQLFLGDGNKLFSAIAAARLRNQASTVRLRLTVEYKGDPPLAAYFCGRRQPFSALSDSTDAPTTPTEPTASSSATPGEGTITLGTSGSGIATADFPAAPLGFHPLSLFTLAQPEQRIAPLHPGAPTAPEDLLAVETTDSPALPRLSDSALTLAPLLQQWFGLHPATALTVLDHAGQPFEDGPLLVAPVAALAGSSAESALLHSLTHAWVQSGQPWMDEGLAEFMDLVYLGQKQGHQAADAALADLLRPVTLAEPDPETLHTTNAGQPLIAAQDELFYRRKAAAVWWTLRSLVGDDNLQLALTTWRSQLPLPGSPRDQALAFEDILFKITHKDLGWFFDDWILHDRGLPDLTIAEASPRPVPLGQGYSGGWIVAVTVRNDGAATTEVPLTVSAGAIKVTHAIHVPGLSTITERIVVPAQPTEVQVNDGTFPELRTTLHTLTINAQPQ